eukprot:scaffold5155_cov80-Skeletonema_dohrnii-CCMP3373.AAC.2
MSVNASNNLNSNNVSVTPREKTATTTNLDLDRPSSFNGGDHGFSHQSDPTNTKSGLSFEDKDEECNNSNHATTLSTLYSYFGFRIAPRSFSFGRNIMSRGTAFILFLIAISSNQVAVIDSGGKIDDGYDITGGGGGGLSSDRTLQLIEYDFVYFGPGVCTDSNNNYFDSVVYIDRLIGGAEACAEKCGDCPGPRQGQVAYRKLLGFTYYDDDDEFGFGNQCVCHLEKGPDFDEDLCPWFGINVRNENEGTGPICNSDRGGGGWECWMVDDPNSVCTTSAPTNDPTAKPSKTGKAAKTKTKNAANVGTNLQVQEMKSRGSSYASITPLVEVTLVSMVALGALFY